MYSSTPFHQSAPPHPSGVGLLKPDFRAENDESRNLTHAERAWAAGVWEEVESLPPSVLYPPATELYRQGSPAREVYLIDGGVVKLTRLEHDGSQMIVSLRFPGWILGAASVIVQKQHPVTAVTSTACSLRRIPGEVFTGLMKTNSRLSWHLHQMHSHEFYDHVTQVMQMGCLPARQRLEHFLKDLISAMEHGKSKNEIRLQLPIKLWEIAELIAVTPEHLSRMLNQMEKEGTIRRNKGWIILSGLTRF